MLYSLSALPQARAEAISGMERERFDLVVIGGGITGAAVARDARQRGLKTALLEKDDFASGTSGRSSRMVHGGLRYVSQGRLGLVRESLRERFTLSRIASTLVRPSRFIFPIQKSAFDALYISVGLLIYDLLSLDCYLGGSRIIGADTAARALPVLRGARFHGALSYPDCTVDDARLTLCTILSALPHGLKALNHARVTGVIFEHGAARGVRVEDVLGGVEFTVKARAVLAAMGPWSNELSDLDATFDRRLVRLTKGVHVMVPRERLSIEQPATVFSPIDHRPLLLLPWRNYTLFGNTDTDFDGDPDRVETGRNDVDYLLASINACLPHLALTVRDVRGAVAGLRPLVYEGEAREMDVSREHRLEQSPTGLFALYGGKLTTNRAMAEEAVDRICAYLGVKAFPCRTRWTSLDGAKPNGLQRCIEEAAKIGERDGWDAETVVHFIHSYGGRAREVMRSVARDPESKQAIHPTVPVRWGEVEYTILHEGAARLSDVMTRRLHLSYLLQDIDQPLVERVMEQMARILGWDAARREQELARYWREHDAARRVWA